MNTMIADPNDFAAPSTFVKEYTGIELPLDFVDKASIDSYKSMVPERLANAHQKTMTNGSLLKPRTLQESLYCCSNSINILQPWR